MGRRSRDHRRSYLYTEAVVIDRILDHDEALRLQRLNDPGRWCELDPSCTPVGPPHRRTNLSV
jgi:hypothetical protein